MELPEPPKGKLYFIAGDQRFDSLGDQVLKLAEKCLLESTDSVSEATVVVLCTTGVPSFKSVDGQLKTFLKKLEKSKRGHLIIKHFQPIDSKASKELVQQHLELASELLNTKLALIGASKLLKDARITTSVVTDDTDADASALEEIEKEISEFTKSLPAVDESPRKRGRPRKEKSDIVVDDDTPKRPRGRPRKSIDSSTPSKEETDSTPKKRGRPAKKAKKEKKEKKEKSTKEEAESTDDDTEKNQSEKSPGKRGRPRKHSKSPKKAESGEKRKRGRPSKSVSEDTDDDSEESSKSSKSEKSPGKKGRGRPRKEGSSTPEKKKKSSKGRGRPRKSTSKSPARKSDDEDNNKSDEEREESPIRDSDNEKEEKEEKSDDEKDSSNESNGKRGRQSNAELIDKLQHFKENHRWDSLKDEPVLYDFVKRMSKQRDAKNQSSSTKYALEKLEEFSFPWGVLKSGAGRPKKLKNKD